jgi:predicted permease
MRFARRFAARLKEMFGQRALESDLDDELHLHRDLLVSEYERRGVPPAEARRRAAITLGGIDQAKERIRDARGFPSFETLLKDMRYAVRLLVRAPAFSSITILTLALGIGVNVAIFSIVDAVMLRPLPYPDSSRLISIWEVNSSRPAAQARSSVAPANLADYQRVSAFDGVAGLAARVRSLTGNVDPEAVMTEEITVNYFAVLGTAPALGRTFSAAEMKPGGHRAAVISDGVWRSRYGAQASALGQILEVDRQPHEIIGVMPASFRALTDFASADPVGVWLPAAYPLDLLANRAEHQIRAVARLADGRTIDAARSELSAISEGLAKAYPATNEHIRTAVQPLRDDIVRNVWMSLTILFVTVALILLIACVNVANLMLARGVGRRREIALRFALGATRVRVISALVTENLVLAGAASALGVVLAMSIKNLLLATAPQNVPRLAGVAIDARVLIYTAAVGLITGVLFGVIPAWQAGHSRPADALSGAGRVVAGRTVMRWRNALMLAQISLSIVLLVGAGLMVKSLLRLNDVALGFTTERVLAMRMMLPDARYPNGVSRLQFFEQLESRVAVIGGVESVGFANNLPLRGGWGGGLLIEGVPAPPEGYFEADMQAVNPGYFKTLGITLERGRLLEGSDVPAALPVAVVSRMFEQRFLNGESALGRQFRRDPKMPAITIVGVVRDVRRDGQTSDVNPQVYLAASQTGLYPVRLSDLAVRTRGNPMDLLPTIRSAVWAIDSQQAITNVRRLDDIVAAGSADRRFRALVFSMFALLALVLASIGTYGVVAYIVNQRMPEIGVHLALGASTARIYRLLLARVAAVVVVGVTLGLIAARWLSQYVATLLFHVETTDPATYITAAAVLVGVALTASVLAGRRATSIDVTSVLRYE